jgi:hypothetical protein
MDCFSKRRWPVFFVVVAVICGYLCALETQVLGIYRGVTFGGARLGADAHQIFFFCLTVVFFGLLR